jgi:hypothetical protein
VVETSLQPKMLPQASERVAGELVVKAETELPQLLRVLAVVDQQPQQQTMRLRLDQG